MQGQIAGAQAAPGKFSQKEKMILYLVITLFLVFAATLVSIMPKGTPLHRCLSIITTSNRYACLANLANSTSNASICGYLQGGYAATCYSNVALKTLNPSYCNYAGTFDPSLGSACLEELAGNTGNLNLCYSLNSSYRQNCLLSLGTKLNNASACLGIANSTMEEACTSAVAIDEAVEYDNPNYCSAASESSNATLLEEVIRSLAYVNLDSYPKLQSLSLYSMTAPGNSYTIKDWCYIMLAGIKGQPSYCTYTSTSYINSVCLAAATNVTVANTTTNYKQVLSSCYSLSGQEQTSCIDAVMLSEATLTKNVSICRSFGNGTLFETCVSSIAKNSRNATYCSFIQNSTANSACIMGVHTNFTT